jgi:Asp-tRNA(Asn)/Glu-tRNA(Gln) amidotransferase A subunit family amidase
LPPAASAQAWRALRVPSAPSLVTARFNICAVPSQDKLGPMARSAADAALIFDVIRGKDANDMDACDANLANPFGMDLSTLVASA